MNDIHQSDFLQLGAVRHLHSEDEAIEVAKDVAKALENYAKDTAYNRVVPYAQAKLVSEAGLTAISVPKEFGGLGASVFTIVNVVKIISAADAGVGQLLQIHFVMVRGVFTGYSDEIRDRLVADILAGKRFGNALAEIGGKNKFSHKTRVDRNAQGQLILNGSKFYSTGSLLAEWISLTAGSDNGPVGILLHRDTPGLELVDDWDAIGQNNSVSGTVNFNNIVVDERFIPKRDAGGFQLRTGLTWPQILHAAMDTGIAVGALNAAVDYLKHHARPWVESGVDAATHEPHIIKQIGEFAALADAAEALLDRSAAIYQQHLADILDEDLQTKLILSVAATRYHSDAASLKISSEIFGLLGASSTLSKWNLDRFWRNARTHTTHDPIRWRLYHIGNYYLNDVPPGEYNSVLLKERAENVTKFK
ncbi:acyl-CoA dehydrogenase family protein [Acinetobacter puyangensis]|uniref:Acyl-CoA dehydrogenase n=1 Tax=Acinetobacter puyangensis TaxID=1096779 RepID=A0A240EB02_9GAMM|nr:acyl-CoA dehydrogenase family protein [Acinetobacter puyangensis]SNX45721.1 Acyl-CoA dehydrogenase [Acinetobacter puyangensis]